MKPWLTAFTVCAMFSAPDLAHAADPKFLLSERCKDAPAKGWTPDVTKGKTPPAVVAVKPAEDSAYAAFDEGCYFKALNLAQAAAAKNEPQAYTLIGQIYEQGLGAIKDDVKAAEAYAQGAALGDFNAQFQIGMMLLQGRGINKNPDKAVSFLELAAQKNHVLANYNLALVFVEGVTRPQDFVKAAQYLEKAAVQEHPQAQFDLGSLYTAGRGVDQDYAKGAYWTGLAAKAGLIDAQLEYGVTLINGRRIRQKGSEVEVVPKNEVIGLKYLEAAAEKGNPVAQNRVSRAYRFGVGTDYDPLKSAKWYIIARGAGATDPLMELFFSKLPQETRDRAEKAAEEWYDERASAY
ncbi:MAG: sel1 repeat family protein [Chitinophagales bacterium]|nr:sel1 repeat family protein [Hyphomicrobiales bacterium]